MKRKKIIAEIKAIISDYGSFSVADVEADTSPVINAIGDTSILAEKFFSEEVELTTYIDGYEVGVNKLPYEELKKGVLKDILELAKDFKERKENNEL